MKRKAKAGVTKADFIKNLQDFIVKKEGQDALDKLDKSPLLRQERQKWITE